MGHPNKITFRNLGISKEELVKESEQYFFESLSDYLRYIIKNRNRVMEVEDAARTAN